MAVSGSFEFGLNAQKLSELELQPESIARLRVNDLPTFVDHEQCGDPVYAISLAGFSVLVPQNREGELGFFYVSLGLVGVLTGGNGQYFETVVLGVIFFVEGLEFGQFHAAGPAPARPKADHEFLFSTVVG